MLPQTRQDLIRAYTFTDSDLSVIQQHRGAANRLGFATLLCCMRYLGVVLGAQDTPASAVLHLVSEQLKTAVPWSDYAQRLQTRREHLIELQRVFGFQTFGLAHYNEALRHLEEVAAQTDKGILLATALVQFLRTRLILLPSLNVLERICAQAVTRATKRVYRTMTEALTREQRSVAWTVYSTFAMTPPRAHLRGCDSRRALPARSISLNTSSDFARSRHLGSAWV